MPNFDESLAFHRGRIRIEGARPDQECVLNNTKPIKYLPGGALPKFIPNSNIKARSEGSEAPPKAVEQVEVASIWQWKITFKVNR